jgi:hypothetical protein
LTEGKDRAEEKKKTKCRHFATGCCPVHGQLLSGTNAVGIRQFNG